MNFITSNKINSSKIFILVSICVVFFISLANSSSQNFKTELLLDGLDSLKYYDIDTTGHWWAITKPFTNRYRAYIDSYESEPAEDLTFPVFAAGGNKWAFYEVYANATVHLISNDGDTITDIPLDATDYGEITYSPNGEYFAYTYFQHDNEVINLPMSEYAPRTRIGELRNPTVINVTNRVGKLFIDNSGSSYTMLGKRNNEYVINTNGKESTTYDSIIPIGYWHNKLFVYAAYNGNSWEIYRGNKQLGFAYNSIIDAKINTAGTILAILVSLNTGRCMSVIFNDEYFEPVYGKSYDNVWGLVLHPTDMLYGYGASEHNRVFIIQNSTEYYAAGDLGRPFYTYNGEELIFTSMGEFGPYISVNGKKTDIKISLYIDDIIAKKPASETFAFTTGISLLVYNYTRNEDWTGYMCDYTSKAVYNRLTDRYEALGVINNRLYLLSCQMQ